MLDYDQCRSSVFFFFFLEVAREKSGRVPRSRHKESRDSLAVMLSRGRAMIPAEVKDRLRAYILSNWYRGWWVHFLHTNVEFIFWQCA